VGSFFLSRFGYGKQATRRSLLSAIYINDCGLMDLAQQNNKGGYGLDD
jgi:hypothetical protein